jgi:hypothetical protein
MPAAAHSSSSILAAETAYPAAFLCPITQLPMNDPVVDPDGNTYEREAIIEWLTSHSATSPVTRAPLALGDLAPNRALQHAIEGHRRHIEEERRWLPARRAREQPRWVADDEVESCMICGAIFGFWVRRTHCRYCGWVVCKGCCPGADGGQLLELDRHVAGDPDPPGGGAQKVCSSCYEQAPEEMRVREHERARARASALASLERTCELVAECDVALEEAGAELRREGCAAHRPAHPQSALSTGTSLCSVFLVCSCL